MKHIITSLVVLTALVFCVHACTKRGEESGETKHKKYLIYPERDINLVEIKFSAIDDKRKGMSYTIKDPEVLRDIQAKLSKGGLDKNNSARIFNSSSDASADYEMVYSDGTILKYSCGILFYHDRIYFDFLYPEDSGFQGDPSIIINATDILGEKELNGIIKIWSMEKEKGDRRP